MPDAINPPHYKTHPSGIECIEVTRHCPFSLGNAIKYIWRYLDKSGVEDLRKARWYLRDIVTTGQSSYPPGRVRNMLRTISDGDTNVARHVLFLMLADGRVNDAIRFIDEIETQHG